MTRKNSNWESNGVGFYPRLRLVDELRELTGIPVCDPVCQHVKQLKHLLYLTRLLWEFNATWPEGHMRGTGSPSGRAPTGTVEARKL